MPRIIYWRHWSQTRRHGIVRLKRPKQKRDRQIGSERQRPPLKIRPRIFCVTLRNRVPAVKRILSVRTLRLSYQYIPR